ncbi:MAG: aminotransferase class V-fold PLP-dependent enzyme [Chitinophagales bacterium]|nr:aminotransferase class V-fold PLP-dependent enzyme [Chitinophagales bacterium]
MNIEEISERLGWLPSPVAAFIEKRIKKVPALKKLVDAENEKTMQVLENSLKPYDGKFDKHITLPSEGINREKILNDIQQMHDLESVRWKEGYVSGGIYHGDKEHIEFLNKAYALQSQSNPLHSDLFPSASKFEAEIISMVAHMHGKGQTTDNAPVVGSVTSGGTESILCAMKAYRDRAREEKGIREPEMVLPDTAHTAFNKAAQYFGIKQVRIPVTNNYTANVNAAKSAINNNTIVMIGSAPAFPHGTFDDIKALSDIALKNGIGFHTDCCLGGFIVPFAEKLGYNIPIVDFRNPGVTSMSVDTHKYGYAAKGTSVVLYRTEELRHYQFFTATDWPGGLYFSPTLAGSRPGALSAACWAAMLSMGEGGYLRATDAIMKTAEKIKAGIKQIPDIKIMGEPHWIIAIGSDTLNIYQVLDRMTKKHWNLNGLHKPACFHIALTLRHTQPEVAEHFLNDLKEAVEYVKANPDTKEGMAPVYGMAASLPFRGMVSDILKRYLDVIYKV